MVHTYLTITSNDDKVDFFFSFLFFFSLLARPPQCSHHQPPGYACTYFRFIALIWPIRSLSLKALSAIGTLISSFAYDLRGWLGVRCQLSIFDSSAHLNMQSVAGPTTPDKHPLLSSTCRCNHRDTGLAHAPLSHNKRYLHLPSSRVAHYRRRLLGANRLPLFC